MSQRDLPPRRPVVLADPLEPVRLEHLNGTDVPAGLVNALDAGVDRVAFQRRRAHRERVADRAGKQVVHEPSAPEPWPHHDADHRPRVCVPDVRDRSRVDQRAISKLRRDRVYLVPIQYTTLLRRRMSALHGGERESDCEKSAANDTLREANTKPKRPR
jgi:hypothetical protein